MADGKGKANEIEPSFNIDDLIELLPDDAMGATNIGMKEEGVPGSSSNLNNLNQENKSVNLENYQVAATQSDIMPPNNRTWKPMDSASGHYLVSSFTSQAMNQEILERNSIVPYNSINSLAHCSQRSTLPNIYAEFSQSQISRNIVSQSNQCQFHNQTAQRPNTQPLSAQFNIYHSNQIQQRPVQQRLSAAFGLQRPQQKIGYHLDSSTMKQHEQFNVLKHHGQVTSDKSLQHISKPVQMRHSLETPSDTGTSGVQSKLLTSAFPHSQSPMLVDQQKTVEQLQTVLLGLLQELESTSQLMLTNSTDWVNPVFKQIQLMNRMYFSEMFILFQRALISYHQATDAESATRSEKNQLFYKNILQFLQIPKTKLMQFSKENIYKFINDIILSLKRCRTKNSVPLQHHQQLNTSGNPSRTSSLQQKGNILQINQVNPFHNSTPTSVPQLLMQQGNTNSPGSSMNQFQFGSSTGLQNSDPSLLMNTFQHSLMKSRQQYSPSQAQQGMSLPQKCSQIGFDSGLLTPSSVGIPQHNTTFSTQQMLTSPGNSFNNLDFTVRSLPQNPVVTASQHNRRQDQHLTVQKNLKQPMQQMLSERNQQQMAKKMNEDAKMAHFAGFNQRMLVKHHSSGQHLEQYQPSLQSSSAPYRGASPQSSQHSSTQLELKDLSSKLSRSTISLLSAASPYAVPSPLTPVTPSSLPTNQEKIHVCFSPLSIEERNKVTNAPIELSLLQPQGVSEHQVPVSVSKEIVKSPLLTESTYPVDYQESHAKTDPVQRLVEVVKSMSRKALHVSVRDINAVTCIIDRKPGSIHQGGSRWVIGQDLADDTRSCEQGNFDMLCTKTRMKRRLRALSADDMTSAFCRSGDFESGQTSQVGYNATSRIKRLKKEPNDLLLEEIREINHDLIETVVEVVDVKDVSRNEGTVIRCLYNAVQCNGNFKILNASTQMLSNLIVELLVTAEYPNSSPVILEGLPPGCSEAEEVKVLWTKAKSNFSLMLRKFSQPISLKEMAKTWDVCAREVFRELVQKFGGGDFSSTYGKWDNCVVST